MPEGDTIFRAARTLDRALKGQVVTRFETQLPQLARVDHDTPVAGRTVERVDAVGKWMRMCFSGDLILVTHMRMNGSWHIYRLGEKWQRGRIQMRVAVYTESFVAVAFQIPVAEFHTAASLARHGSLQRLGPDVVAQEFDPGAAIAQLRSRPELEVGVALLSQSLIAGLGNVFKSEVCFVSHIHPFRNVGTLSIEELASLVNNARRLISANVTEGARAGIRTTGRLNPSESLWVYKRRGEPCHVCGTPIVAQKQGVDARTTFWCPRCQRAQDAPNC
jgi:endonuclease-8